MVFLVDVTKEIVEYRITAHLFGATSSPSVADFALKKAADDHENLHGSDAANFIRTDFYVDDGLKSVATVNEAVTLIKQSKAICSVGGFNFHKFLSNSREILETTSTHERVNAVRV